MTEDKESSENIIPLTSSGKKGDGDDTRSGLGLNFRLAFAIGAGAFGPAFQHGYNTGVLNAPQKLITEWIGECNTTLMKEVDKDSTDMDTSECKHGNNEVVLIWSWIVAVFCVGGVIGGSAIGVVSSRLGRKGGLLLNNVLMLIAGVFLFAAKYAGSWELLIVGRLIIGINSGLNAGLAPMYLNEISPTALRGAVGTVYQLFLVMSILLSQILGLTNVLGNDMGWPFLLGLTIIPGILQVITLPFCPESPKYLLLDKNDDNSATSALAWLRNVKPSEVKSEMDEMRAESETIKSLPKVTFKNMLMDPALRAPLIIAMMMMLAQQLSGINAAIYFSTSIFTSAGLSEKDAQSATLGMGGMNVAMTFVSLVLIEKAGRKTLMLIGLSVMVVCTTMLLICLELGDAVPALKYLSIVMVIAFVVGFATGPGSIPWFFVTELFTQSARGMATSIAVVTNWTANFLVGLGFAPLMLVMGPWVFVIFIVLQILFILYVWFKVPETKNKSIEEITAQFRQTL